MPTFALDGLAAIDAYALAAILAKTLSYGAAFLAMGGALFAALFPDLTGPGLRALRRATAMAAAIGLAIIAIRIGLRAARISGMGIDGMVDPTMVTIVWQSPLGTAAFVQTLGFVLVFAILLAGPIANTVRVIGATLIAISFTEVGHSLGDARAVLAALLTIHVLAGAFWIGALYPLWKIADDGRAGPGHLHRFGAIASITVPILALAGVGFAFISVGSWSALWQTAYGLTLLVKTGLVALLLAAAAANKLRLVPAIEVGEPGAVVSLRRSIAIEGSLAGLIFLMTAVMTSVTTPPMNL